MQAPKLSALLLEQQLIYFGSLAQRPVMCPVRQLVFEDDLTMAKTQFDRRVGRPRTEWKKEIFKVIDRAFASANEFRVCIANPLNWRKRVRAFCRAKPQS